ncbi:hypothetical protein GBAR_LOCUS28356, partial [Geodia barretti]
MRLQLAALRSLWVELCHRDPSNFRGCPCHRLAGRHRSLHLLLLPLVYLALVQDRHKSPLHPLLMCNFKCPPSHTPPSPPSPSSHRSHQPHILTLLPHPHLDSLFFKPATNPLFKSTYIPFSQATGHTSPTLFLLSPQTHLNSTPSSQATGHTYATLLHPLLHSCHLHTPSTLPCFVPLHSCSLLPPTSTTQFAPPTGSSPTLATSYLPVSAAAAAASGGIRSDSGGGGGTGTLFTIGGDTTTSVSPPVQQQPSQTPPVPKPRAHAAAGQQVPNSAHLPYHPVPAPRSHPSPVMTGAAPKPPPARPSVQARASSLMANLPQGQPLLSRPGLGVPVLPPIPPRSSTSPSFPSSHTSPPSHPPSSSPPCPPPYQRQSSPTGDGGNRSGSPPPPYYPSPHGANDNRRFSQPVPLPSQQHTPSHFTLPDPQVWLTCNFMLFATKFCASFT